jgi:phosphatidylglycerophosphatase A
LSSSKPKASLPPHDIWSLIAVAYPFGLASRAPGTWGSLPGLGVGALFYGIGQTTEQSLGIPSSIAVTILILLLTGLAWYAIHRTEKRWQTHDDGRIVVDEVLGQAIAISFLGPSTLVLIASFLLFRLLDIWKPGPIGWADEKLPGAWGTLIDDVIAGFAVVPLVFLLSRVLQMKL